MGIFQIFHFEWWQALIFLVFLIASPLIKAIAVVIVGKFVNPELAKIALPLIFKYKVQNRKIKSADKN